MIMKKKGIRNVIGASLLTISCLGAVFCTGIGAKEVWAASILVGADLVEGLDRDPETYILANSDKEELTYDQIRDLSATERQMAVNEIYARRGRKFVLTEVQNYFNDKFWYDGTIAPEDFDESIFNEYENANLALLCKSLEKYRN